MNKDIESERNDKLVNVIRESAYLDLPQPDPELRRALDQTLKQQPASSAAERKSILRSPILLAAVSSAAAIVAIGFFLWQNEEAYLLQRLGDSSPAVASKDAFSVEIVGGTEFLEALDAQTEEADAPVFGNTYGNELVDGETRREIGELDALIKNATGDFKEPDFPTQVRDLSGTGKASRSSAGGWRLSGTDVNERYERNSKRRMVKEFGGSITMSADANHMMGGHTNAGNGYPTHKESETYEWEEEELVQTRNGEQYEPIHENQFITPTGENALSTFSIDVDTASYSNVRRFLSSGRLPPPNAVRIEELINYFSYDYPQPKNDDPFSVNMEVAACPWSPGNRLLRIGLKGKEIHQQERPISNLVFLLDVSGSMQNVDKLPLLKRGLKMMVDQLGENDTVSIVTYASGTGVKLPPTNGTDKATIMRAIDELSAGGSTHGSAGINLAYEQAELNFLEDGTNRVILATDGDLNVGITKDDELVKLIKEKAAGNIFLTVLGFGTGNLKDGKMEKLADNGNGVYAYIDSVREAREVLVKQMSGSLITIAKDVKLQLEFNPAQVKAYRLIGYENRIMAARDFDDDRKDAGEIGAGHTVTALYEIVPTGAAAAKADDGKPSKKLKYQQQTEVKVAAPETELTEAAESDELLTLSLRFKQPDAGESKKIEFTTSDDGTPFNEASEEFRFAASVASFGMLLRNSSHRGSATLSAVEEIASGALGDDAGGYRTEFIDLVRRAARLK